MLNKLLGLQPMAALCECTYKKEVCIQGRWHYIWTDCRTGEVCRDAVSQPGMTCL